MAEIEKGNDYAREVKASLQDAVVAFTNVSNIIAQATEMTKVQAEDMKLVRKEVDELVGHFKY